MFRSKSLVFLILLTITFTNCQDTMNNTELNIQANLVFFYYSDLEKAQRFYEEVLGFERVLDYGFATIHRISGSSFIGLVDETKGMHKTTEPKSVTLAIVTEEIGEWYEYLVSRDVEMRGAFDPKEGRPHVGFVAFDPEGYFLEFETFTDHPENAKLTPILSQTETLYPSPGQDTGRPANLGVQSSVLWLYYKDLDAANRYYEDVFGFEQVVEQAYSTVYDNGTGSYIGLVDESRGLNKFSEEKSVTVSFISEDIDRWYERLTEKGLTFRNELSDSENEPVRAFVAFDLGKYFIEFDKFHEEDERNTQILGILRK
ncbi:MAG: VOC family protein [bacterium]|nr:VOC family protein [bacterium]